MAVYERSFAPYEGPLTAPRYRFLVPARYALRDLFRSKLFVVFLTICYVFPFLALLAIYLRHNADLISTFAGMGVELDDWVPIDNRFFGVLLRVQGSLGFFLVLFTGPRLVSRDLANNGLALYLCRPFSRTQYVAGKLTVLVALVSGVTWVPGLLLWLLQAGLAGGGWAAANLRSAGALLVGSWVWIAVLASLALAVSAWVKWRVLAGFVLLLIYFGGGFFGRVFELLFQSEWGHLIDLHHTMRRVWAQLFDTTMPFFLFTPAELPVWPAWAMLALVVGLSLALLARRVRAYEVVS